MDLRHYRSFIALSEERSFTAAARRLNIVQSGLSQTIKEMEEELGVRLVDRTTRRLSLTGAGRLLLEYAKSGVTALSDGIEAIRADSSIVRGRIRLGILESLEPYIDLPAVLQKFRTQYSEVEFAVRSVDSIRAPELVLDLSFHAEITKVKLAGVDATPFFKDSLVAVCAKTHELATQDRASLSEVARFPFVDLTAERALRVLIDRCMADNDIERKSVYEVSGVATMMRFVAGGLGGSIVPAVLAAAWKPALSLHVLRLQRQSVRIPEWKLVTLIRPHRQKLSGKTLPELMLGAIAEVAGATTVLRGRTLRRPILPGALPK